MSPTRNSELETQTVGFQVATYDPTKPLIIDPKLEYSTYLGGSGFDHGFGIAVDAEGNTYVTGVTLSTNFPTESPLQTGGYAFVTKLNATGSALIYSTYLDDVGGIAVDPSGNAYVVGSTSSTNFPTTPGAFDTTCGTDGQCNFKCTLRAAIEQANENSGQDTITFDIPAAEVTVPVILPKSPLPTITERVISGQTSISVWKISRRACLPSFRPLVGSGAFLRAKIRTSWRA